MDNIRTRGTCAICGECVNPVYKIAHEWLCQNCSYNIREKVEAAINEKNEHDQTLNGLSELTDEFKNRTPIHIYVKHRTSRHSITMIEGLTETTFGPKLNIPDIVKIMKTTFHCNGSVCNNLGELTVQLSGDQREHIKNLLKDYGIDKSNIVVHGY